MTAKLFTYRGHLGADIDMKNGKFINDITQPGQLGCVIDTKEVSITPAAKKMLEDAKREGGSFAEIMLTKHADGSGSSVGLLGFGKIHLGTEPMIGRECDKSILADCHIEEFEAPDDFKLYIDQSEQLVSEIKH